MGVSSSVGFYGNAVTSFASSSARDTAISLPVEGMLSFTTDTNRLWVYSGSAWIPIAGSMPRFKVTGGGAGQTGVVTATNTTCTWANGSEVEDTEGAIAIGTGVFTCPAGLPGRWAFQFSVKFDPNNTGIRYAWLAYSVGPAMYARTNMVNLGGTAVELLQGSAEIVMTAGSTVSVVVHQTSGANRTVNTDADQYFQGRFISEN